MTNPERFAPLHDIAADLLDRLEREFDVTREEGYGLDDRLERDPSRPTVRLTPSDPEAGALALGFTSFPGIILATGTWAALPLPFCGCDACDESVETTQSELDKTVEALVSGSFSEWIELPRVGAGRYHHEMPGSSGWSRLERADAKARIDRAGGRTRFDYAPWPPRAER